MAGDEAGSGRERAVWCAALAVLALAALAIYRGAIPGAFLADDVLNIVHNPYVRDLDAAALRAILDPAGDAAFFTQNYAPVATLVHAAEWRAFGEDPRGFHLVNVALHAGVAWLLGLLLRRSGVSLPVSLAGAAFFLAHVANVETVAWIFQLKTLLASLLGFLALLALPRRPGLATACFALAILAKFTAGSVLAFALPLAILAGRRGEPARWGWLCAWALLFALLTAVELPVFRSRGEFTAAGHPDVFAHARFVLAVLARYLAMAATGHGVSAWHQPDLQVGLLDPWWIAGLVAGVGLGARGLWALHRGRNEAAWAAFALGSFLPFSQILPFEYPMADHYLYSILPGLLGLGLLAAQDAAPFVSARLAALPLPTLPWPPATVVGAAALGAASLGMAFAAAERTRIFRTDATLMQDAVRHYPDGTPALLVRARRAASVGDLAQAAAALEAVAARGNESFLVYASDPHLGPAAWRETRIRIAIEEMAARAIRRFERIEKPSQMEWLRVGQAHAVRGEREQSIRALERALETPGPVSELVRSQLEEVVAEERPLWQTRGP